MGSISRMRRSDRFIDEFAADYVAQFAKDTGIKPGATLTVQEVTVYQEDGNFEQVHLGLKVVNEKGDDFNVSFDIVFDPENDSGEELTERVQNQLAITESVARDRVKKADLY